MYRSDVHALDKALSALRDAVRLSDVPSLALPDITERLGHARSMRAALDLYVGRLAAQAEALHGRPGAASAADAAGMSKNEAERLTTAATNVDSLPLVEAAVLDGSLSSTDAALIAGACAKDPSAEDRLINIAKSKPDDLRGECLNVRNSAEADAERARRHHRKRSFRTWTGDDGETCGRFSLPPEVAAPIITAIRAQAGRLMKERSGPLEAQERYAADAFVKLFTEGGVAVKTVVSVATDLDVLRRGDTLEGERCEIPGVGPVNAAWVRSILGEATVNLIIRNGVDVVSVTRLGRRIPAEVMTALLFKPRRCNQPGCTKGGYLERDHIVEVARGGPSSLANLQWLCAEHHRQKTRRYVGEERYRPNKPRQRTNPSGNETARGR